MSDEQVVIETLETVESNQQAGKAVAWYGSRKRASIVFLPQGTPIGQKVRVKLVPQMKDGKPKLDGGGKPIYNGLPAPDLITHQWHAEGDVAARFEIATDWLGYVDPAKVREVERRPLAERFGIKHVTERTELVWGADQATTVIRVTATPYTPIERETVVDGQLRWEQVDKVIDPEITTDCPVTDWRVDEWCSWQKNRLQPTYDPAWQVTLKLTYTKPTSSWGSSHGTTAAWAELPAWYQAQLAATYPVCACGRERLDIAQAAGYPRCAQCRKEAACDRCGKVTGRVKQVADKAVCDNCTDYERAEGWIRTNLTPERLASIADQARILLAGTHYAGAEGEVLLRNLPSNLWRDWQAGYAHYYFLAEGCVVGSKLTPAALTILQFIATAAGNPLVEFVNWLTPLERHKLESYQSPENDFYMATQVLAKLKNIDLQEYEIESLSQLIKDEKLVLGKLLNGLWVPEQAAAHAKARAQAAIDQLRCPLCGQRFDNQSRCDGSLRLGDYGIALEIPAQGADVRYLNISSGRQGRVRPNEEIPVGTITRWILRFSNATWWIQSYSGSGKTDPESNVRLTPGRWIFDRSGEGWRPCPEHDIYNRVAWQTVPSHQYIEEYGNTRLAELHLSSGELAATVYIAGHTDREHGLGTVVCATWDKPARLADGESWWNGKAFEGQLSHHDLARVRPPVSPTVTPKATPRPPAPAKPRKEDVAPTDPATLDALKNWANKRGGRND